MKSKIEIQISLQYFSDKEIEDEVNLSNYLLSEIFVKELRDELINIIKIYKNEIRQRKLDKLKNY